MGLSNEWTEWHLTPRGWERGSERTDSKGLMDRGAPSDSMMTSKYAEVMTSPFSPPKQSTHTIWRHSDDNQIASLLDRFGPAPDRL